MTSQYVVAMRGHIGEETPPAPFVQVGDIELDDDRHEVRARGALVELAPKEFALLAFLMRHAGFVFTRQVLLERVWGSSKALERTIDVHVRLIRAKLERDPAEPKYIVTIRGRGYKFADPRPARMEATGDDGRLHYSQSLH